MGIVNWFINIFSFGKKGKKKVKAIVSNSQQEQESMMASVAQQMQRDPHEMVMDLSQKHLNDLKIYVNYFSEEDLMEKVHTQTQVIHEVFNENKDLNYKQLEQFHMYYTDHLLEVLKNLKKKYDEKNLVFKSQIKALKEIVSKHQEKETKINVDNKKANNNKAQYASFITLCLTSIYNCIVTKFDDFRFKSKDQLLKLTYTYKYGLDFAWEVPMTIFEKVTELLTDEMTDSKGQKLGAPYKYNGYTIERNLLGRLNRHHYHVTFIGTFRLEGQEDYFELFQISDTEDYFIIHVEFGLLRFVDINVLSEFMKDRNTKLGQIVNTISENEDQIRDLTFKMKDTPRFTGEIKEMMNKYIETISKQELITDFSTVDHHRRNLEAIMELERMVR
jgi:hypothetical protein